MYVDYNNITIQSLNYLLQVSLYENGIPWSSIWTYLFPVVSFCEFYVSVSPHILSRKVVVVYIKATAVLLGLNPSYAHLID